MDYAVPSGPRVLQLRLGAGQGICHAVLRETLTAKSRAMGTLKTSSSSC